MTLMHLLSNISFVILNENVYQYVIYVYISRYIYIQCYIILNGSLRPNLIRKRNVSKVLKMFTRGCQVVTLYMYVGSS